ncbi:type I-E CRISPR-associated protein Cas5/CasD [Schaalia hyovaginalis]|uniref:type I-E CRISPR-associated protein Cas5/CasD n=1 Tax=Schaalia hyovaginalis TaxID=29316 RepID=UPI002A83B544|nr:type I-E CRISPR-associated protein Cas5/CasD [Schaalia hyovaginalis]MDY4491856.1 type I-E CRISPR-associated protein Cas5/CasD [Schaalia hyovaginalis]
MSRVLVLRLAGPMQSWGSASRFTNRSTEFFPTKSGIVGLLAAAEGRRRTDPIEDLASLTMAARIDQPGELLEDFHTAHRGDKAMPLSWRYYVSDAVFAAFIGGPDDLIDALADAIRNPVYPLFLGRRACPPTLPLLLETREGTIWKAIEELPWLAANFHQRRHRFDERVSLRVVADRGVIPGQDLSTRDIRDVPITFDPLRREYGTRTVEESRVDIMNPAFVSVRNPGLGGEVLSHDPMEVL